MGVKIRWNSVEYRGDESRLKEKYTRTPASLPIKQTRNPVNTGFSLSVGYALIKLLEAIPYTNSTAVRVQRPNPVVL